MAECRYRGLCGIERYADFKFCYPCRGYVIEECFKYEPMPDVRALMTLADEFDSVYMHKAATRIRDALGVNNG